MATLTDFGLIAIGYIGRQLGQNIIRWLIAWVWKHWQQAHPAEALFYEHARLWGQKLHKRLDPRKCQECKTIK